MMAPEHTVVYRLPASHRPILKLSGPVVARWDAGVPLDSPEPESVHSLGWHQPVERVERAA